MRDIPNKKITKKKKGKQQTHTAPTDEINKIWTDIICSACCAYFYLLQPVFKSPRRSFQPHPLSSHHCIHLIHPSTCPALITVGFGCILSLLLGQRQLHWEGICCTLHLSGGCRARRFLAMIDQVSKGINKNNSENPWWERNSAFQMHQPVSVFAKGIFNLFWLFSNLHLMSDVPARFFCNYFSPWCRLVWTFKTNGMV